MKNLLSQRVLIAWRARLCACLMVFALLGSVVHAEDAEFETNLKQARLFIKKGKGWYRDAIKELRRAISTEEGRKSFEAHLLLAQTCFKEFDIGCATLYADKSRSLARSPEEKGAAEGMMDYLANNFGKVEFQAGAGELNEGYLELKPKEPMLDKDVKAYFKEKVEPLADQRRTLPWVMYLPAIEWELHGQAFTVEGGKESVQTAGFNAENSKPKPMKAPPPPEFSGMGIATQVRIGAGASLLNVGSLNFGPVLDVSIHKTLGESLMVGLFGRGNLTAMPEGSSVNMKIPIMAGPIATYALPLSRDLALLPALGYGLGEGPVKVYEGCSSVLQDGSEVVSCPSSGGSGDIQVVLNTLVHGPVLRLEAAWQRKTKSNVMMAQLGLQGQYTLSTLSAPESSNAAFSAIELEDAGSLGRSLRVDLMAGVNFTF